MKSIIRPNSSPPSQSATKTRDFRVRKRLLPLNNVLTHSHFLFPLHCHCPTAASLFTSRRFLKRATTIVPKRKKNYKKTTAEIKHLPTKTAQPRPKKPKKKGAKLLPYSSVLPCFLWLCFINSSTPSPLPSWNDHILHLIIACSERKNPTNPPNPTQPTVTTTSSCMCVYISVARVIYPHSRESKKLWACPAIAVKIVSFSSPSTEFSISPPGSFVSVSVVAPFSRLFCELSLFVWWRPSGEEYRRGGRPRRVVVVMTRTGGTTTMCRWLLLGGFNRSLQIGGTSSRNGLLVKHVFVDQLPLCCGCGLISFY